MMLNFKMTPRLVSQGQLRAFLWTVLIGCALVFIITNTYILCVGQIGLQMFPRRSYLDVPINTSRFMHPKGELRERRLPRAIIAGVSKCGTRALIDFMNLHPNIVGAGREVNFFNNLTFFKQGPDAYRMHLPRSYSNQITIEKSPDYFECTLCPERILETLEDVKIIFILCNPIDRMVSQYMQAKHDRGLKDTIEEWVILTKFGIVKRSHHQIRSGLYDEYIAYWLRFFPREKVHVIDGTQLQKDPIHEVKRVEKFLGLRPYISTSDIYFNETRGFHCMYLDRFTRETYCLGSSKGRAHEQVPPNTYEMLQDFYRPHKERLNNIFQYPVNWW